jgi:hypothetical protein
MNNLSDINSAIKPVVDALEKMDIQYFIGGSVASSILGVPRTTIDVDLVADIQSCHVSKLIEILGKEYYVEPSAIREAISRNSSFNMIHHLTCFKIDVFILKRRIFDRISMQRRIRDSLDEQNPALEFCFASPEDLLLNKLEWFKIGNCVSERQWFDVLGILRIQGNHLDCDYLEKWAEDLGVLDLLKKAEAEAVI